MNSLRHLMVLIGMCILTYALFIAPTPTTFLLALGSFSAGAPWFVKDQKITETPWINSLRHLTVFIGVCMILYIPLIAPEALIEPSMGLFWVVLAMFALIAPWTVKDQKIIKGI